jgi:hypothetical protein
MKKTFTLLVALSFLIFGGACFTPALYEKSAEETHNFVEQISTFLITQDGKSLIVVGKQHHYIFNANDTLKFILTWPEKKRVKTTFSNFVISSDQTVAGSYYLTVDANQNLSAETHKLLISKGFNENKLEKTLVYTGFIQGVRYAADQFELPATLQLNQNYTITMTENQTSASATIKRILLTPLAVTADGLLILGGTPVLLFLLFTDAMDFR